MEPPPRISDHQERTWVVEETPSSANFVSTIDNAVSKTGITLLQSVCEINARKAGADDNDVKVDVLTTMCHD